MNNIENNISANFSNQFGLGTISNIFDCMEAEEISLKETVYVFKSIVMLLINRSY